MLSHMKTTINLPDALWQSARRYAKEHNTTVTALIQEGLHKVLHERITSQRFALPDCSFGEGGLSAEFCGRGWDQIREAAYDTDRR